MGSILSVKAHANSVLSSASYRFGPVMVDPGDADFIAEAPVKTVLLTHCHFDHIYGLNELVRLNPEALVYTNEKGREMLENPRRNLSFYQGEPFTFSRMENVRIVSEGDRIPLGEGHYATVYETPGHNPSCITYEIEGYLITGDAYIPGVKTVTNLPRGFKADAEASLKRILCLAEHPYPKTILPGHIL